MGSDFIQSTVILLVVNLVYAVTALVVGVLAVLGIDHFLFSQDRLPGGDREGQHRGGHLRWCAPAVRGDHH
jgi:hypothetical protein